MKRLIKYELSCFFKSYKNLGVMALVLAFCCLVPVVMASQESTWLRESIAENSAIKANAEYKASIYSSEDSILPPEIEKNKQFYYDAWMRESRACLFLDINQKIPGKYSPRQLLQSRIDLDENRLDGLANGWFTIEELRIDPATGIVDIHRNLAVNKQLRDRDLEPHQSPYSLDSANYLLYLVNGPIGLWTVLVAMLLSFDSFSGERENGMYKTVFVSPFSRIKVLLAKTLVSLFGTLITAVGIPLLCAAVISAVWGRGFDYPVVTGQGSFSLLFQPMTADTVRVITAGDALLQSLPVILLVLVFSVVCGLLVSALSRRSLASVTNLLYIGILSIFMISLPRAEQPIIALWPISLADAGFLLGQYSGVTLLAATLTLAAFSVVLLAVLAVYIHKADLLEA